MMRMSNEWSLGVRWGSVATALLVGLSSGSAAAQTEVVVNAAQTHQHIDGFGASSAFFGAEISDEDAEWLFSEDDGIGLTLHRVLIETDATTPELETAKQAYSYGARIWATAWTPPPEWKTNNAREANANGALGRLKPENYEDYANHLADFAEWMESEGVPLVAISPQNEPDWEATWDGCVWSPQEMVTFVRDHMGPVFEARGLDTMIAAPDTAFLREMPSFFAAFEADPEAMKYLGVVATHPYSSDGFDWSWTGAADNDKLFWQTEISWEAQHAGTPTDTPDPGMTTALWMVSMLHEHVTVLNMNAWNYWAIVHSGEFTQDTDAQRQNPAFIQGGVRFKRGYAMGNYAKFVRPGFMRIDAAPSGTGDVLTTAYSGDDRIVIVAINNGQSVSSQTYSLEGLDGTVSSAVPWVTSDDFALEAQAPVTVTDGSFQYSLPARSVTSLVIDVDVPADEPAAEDPLNPEDPSNETDDAGAPLPGEDGTAAPGDGEGANDPASGDPATGDNPVPVEGADPAAPPGTATPAPSTPAAPSATPNPMPGATGSTTAPVATTGSVGAAPPETAGGTPPPAPGASGGVNPSSVPGAQPTLGMDQGTASGDESGCGCAVIGRQPVGSARTTWAAMLALGAALWLGRTRRRIA